ncbi:GNAT family N-acetyltransferase [Pseudomonas chlororaphis]|uniref:GNAT family N-acetyltransferase n=1 Tax=Pseudomonas chlororaphis TaxID=587753 RepID=UPI0003D2A224|nr:N-acetyltransferase [Pseudomonas chlororaphis]AZD31630.1 Protein export cytoplasm protein SecA ATPase RNA helicase [Pseudomonas chlororaphis]ETD40474.1 GNAT family acetyltransferase [Pseudomonas chlororaphis subsp. aurantiaca PB-St2]QFS56942.1 GNAT family N-acetyltransferase [Pseudomonas chlororaphis subsp. aurantiaca]
MADDYCLLMRRDLTGQPAPASWPAAFSLGSYRPELAEAVHGLMHLGYQDGGGCVPELDIWRQRFESDAEYDPQLCLVAQDAEGVVGVIQCWTSAYIKDLVVHPRARRQGLGRALLLQAFAVFRLRREAFVDLRVLEDNQRARGLYDSVGMVAIRREQVPQTPL